MKRGILRDCLTGSNARIKVDGWVPRWMAFSPRVYTDWCGNGAVGRAAQVTSLAAPEPSGEEEASAEAGEPVEQPRAHAA